MGHYDNCRPDQRFSSKESRPVSIYGTKGSLWIIHDWDQRRTISVGTAWHENEEDFIFEALAEHIDHDIPRDSQLVEVGQAGELIWYSTDASKDRALIPWYPSTTSFPSHIPRVHRSDLTEKERMGLQVDLVTCRVGSGEDQNIRQFAFKYYIHPDYIASTWNETNCWMRIPSHPNIVPFHSLVFDSVPTLSMNYDSVVTHNKEKVVGFTTCFIPGGTILDNISRPFRLTHLHQLIGVVDYLNLELGIVHGDITTYNLLIEPDTDTLKIFDFNLASHLGDTEGDNSTRIKRIFSYEEERNDVKFTIFTLYEIITRDMHFREENEPQELEVATMLPAVWDKHPEVQLDAPVEEYRRVLDEWVKRREDVKDEITHWKQAKSPLEWPPLPEFDEMLWGGELYRRESSMRQELDAYELGHLNWQRPATCELPVLTPEGGGRRLLATGEVIDENGEAVDIGTQILSVEGGSEDGTSTVGKDSVDEEMTDTE